MIHRNRALAIALATAAVLGASLAALAQFGGPQAEYQARLKNTDTSSADQLYALAKWCVQNEMFDEAVKQAVAALKIEPQDVRAKYVIYLATGGATDVQAADDVAQMAGTTSIEVVKAPDVSDEEVAKIIQDETPEVMNAFREFQNILIARCGTPQCHGGGNPQARFVLTRIASNSDRTRVQNFLAISPYINRENPDQSRLLTAPLTGPEEHPTKVIRNQSDPVYRIGTTWIDKLLTSSEKMWRQANEPGASPFGQ